MTFRRLPVCLLNVLHKLNLRPKILLPKQKELSHNCLPLNLGKILKTALLENARQELLLRNKERSWEVIFDEEKGHHWARRSWGKLVIRILIGSVTFWSLGRPYDNTFMNWWNCQALTLQDFLPKYCGRNAAFKNSERLRGSLHQGWALTGNHRNYAETTKFPHQQIRWNYVILQSVSFIEAINLIVYSEGAL